MLIVGGWVKSESWGRRPNESRQQFLTKKHS